jgi:hypothetical protein
MKRLFAITIVMLMVSASSAWACMYPMMMNTSTETSKKDANRQVNDNQTSPTRAQVKSNAQHYTKSRSKKSKSGFGFDNLRLDAGFNYTEFSDRSINVQGDVEDYNLILSGDLNESWSFTLGYNHNRLDTNEGPEIVIESEGLNGSLHYAINEHYGIGAFASYNWVDYENLNGNSFAWATGAFFYNKS